MVRRRLAEYRPGYAYAPRLRADCRQLDQAAGETYLASSCQCPCFAASVPAARERRRVSRRKPDQTEAAAFTLCFGRARWRGMLRSVHSLYRKSTTAHAASLFFRALIVFPKYPGPRFLS